MFFGVYFPVLLVWNMLYLNSYGNFPNWQVLLRLIWALDNSNILCGLLKYILRTVKTKIRFLKFKFKHIYFTSIEKQVLTTFTNLFRFCFLGTTPVLAPNAWANEKFIAFKVNIAVSYRQMFFGVYFPVLLVWNMLYLNSYGNFPNWQVLLRLIWALDNSNILCGLELGT